MPSSARVIGIGGKGCPQHQGEQKHRQRGPDPAALGLADSELARAKKQKHVGGVSAQHPRTARLSWSSTRPPPHDHRMGVMLASHAQWGTVHPEWRELETVMVRVRREAIEQMARWYQQW